MDIDGDSDDFDRENLIILRLRGKKYGGYLLRSTLNGVKGVVWL